MDVKKLIAALTDKAVIDTLSSVFQPIIAQSVACISDLKTMIEELRNDLHSKDELIDKLKLENDVLQSTVQETNQRLDLLETYTRVDNLIVKGLPESYSEVVTGGDSGPEAGSSDASLEQVLCLINSNLKIKVTSSDVSAVHRLPKGKQDKYKPIIVRFLSRRLRDEVYRARKLLRQVTIAASNSDPGDENGTCRVFINEHLTKSNERTFAHCRKLWKEKKISGTWTWHGITYIKLRNGRIQKIVQQEDVQKFIV